MNALAVDQDLANYFVKTNMRYKEDERLAMPLNSEIGERRAAARCRSVKKLLPGRAEPRPNWSISDRND